MWKGKNQFLPTCLNVGCQKKFTQAKNSLAKLKISLQPEQTICLEHIIPMGTCAHLARCAYVRSGADEKTWFTIGVPNPNVFNRVEVRPLRRQLEFPFTNIKRYLYGLDFQQTRFKNGKKKRSSPNCCPRLGSTHIFLKCPPTLQH